MLSQKTRKRFKRRRLFKRLKLSWQKKIEPETRFRLGIADSRHPGNRMHQSVVRLKRKKRHLNPLKLKRA